MNTIAMAMGFLYFAIAPLLSINQVRIGPISLYTIVGLLAVAALIFPPYAKRVISDRPWRIASILLLAACAIGLARATEAGRPSTVIALLRFVTTWLIISLTPLDRKRLGRYAGAWVIGLCLAGMLQIFNETHAPFEVGAGSRYSYSRYLQGQREFDLMTRMNLFDTQGYMAMSITAVCCIALAGFRRQYWQKAGLAACGIFLILAERRGGFVVADLLAALGLFMIIPMFFRTPSVSKIKVLVLGFIAIVGLISIAFFLTDWSNILPRLEKMADVGVLADRSISERIDFLDVSINSWLSNLVFGVGFAGFIEDAYLTVGLHCSLVDVPAQLGILGLAGYYGFILVPLKRANRILHSRNNTPAEQSCALIVALGLILYFIGSLFNPVFLINLLNETLLLLAAFGATLPRRQAPFILPAAARPPAPVQDIVAYQPSATEPARP